MVGRRRSTALLMTLPLAHGLTLNPGVEWTESTESNSEYDAVIGTLGSTARLIPGVLSTRLQLRAKRHSSERQADECTDVHAENHYDWIVRRSGQISPRISVSMGGDYHYTENSPGCSSDTERYAPLPAWRCAGPPNETPSPFRERPHPLQQNRQQGQITHQREDHGQAGQQTEIDGRHEVR